MSTPAGRRRLEAYKDKTDHAIVDPGPAFDWETGRQRPSEAAAKADAAAATTVEQEQPRRIAISPVVDGVRQALASREPVWFPADEIPSEFLDRRPLEADTREEMDEVPEDTETEYLGMKRDLVASVLLTQLGSVNDNVAMSEPLGHSRDIVGAVGMSHDKTGRHVVSEV